MALRPNKKQIDVKTRRHTFFSKAGLFLSRGRLFGNKGTLLKERIKILNDSRDT